MTYPGLIRDLRYRTSQPNQLFSNDFLPRRLVVTAIWPNQHRSEAKTAWIIVVQQAIAAVSRCQRAMNDTAYRSIAITLPQAGWQACPFPMALPRKARARGIFPIAVEGVGPPCSRGRAMGDSSSQLAPSRACRPVQNLVTLEALGTATLQ